MRAMSVSELSQMSKNTKAKSFKSTNLRAMTATAPRLENTQILSLNGRNKIPKSVRIKMIRGSIWLNFL